jgi:amino-acid N-acetyltransferase
MKTMATREASVTVAPAIDDDRSAVLALLRSCDLPVAGVSQGLMRDYLVAHVDRTMAGVCGLEVHGQDGLLRSVAVKRRWRRRGVAEALLEAALGRARSLHLHGVYLLTTTAHDYFARRGFDDCQRDAAPAAIQGSWEFRTGCPSSSSLMRREVSG